jgi:hypothetical protein
MSSFRSALFSTSKNSFKMAAVNMDSIQFYQPSFITSLFWSQHNNVADEGYLLLDFSFCGNA